MKQHQFEAYKKRLAKFLQCVVNIDIYRSNKHTQDFFEISLLSFNMRLGGKEKESEVFKRVGGRSFNIGWLGLHRCDPTWHRRWLLVKNSFVAYLNKDTDQIREVMLFDKKFSVNAGNDKGLIISNGSRKLMVQCYSNRQAREWVCDIGKVMGKSRDYTEDTRYESFAPIRKDCFIKWHVDGKSYFSDVADAILFAKEEIFIADFWLSPEVALKRSAHSYVQLDQLLKQQANKGVKIYILLYKEVEGALGCNSAYAKRTLLALNSENIFVLRHPDHVGSTSTLLWAHHEKLVCIDQRICLLGGIDLCFGRWDDHQHKLTDFGSSKPNFLNQVSQSVVETGCTFGLLDSDYADAAMHQQKRDSTKQISKVFIGKDYTNPYVADPMCWGGLEKPFVDHIEIDRYKTQRMPWHDIGCVVSGEPAMDVARHFIQRWNFTKQEKAKKSTAKYPLLLPKMQQVGDDIDFMSTMQGVVKCDVQVLRSACKWSCGSDIDECSIQNAYVDKIKHAKYYVYIENQFFITSLKPGGQNGKDGVHNVIGDALVERITRAHKGKETFRVFIVMPLLPCFPGEIGDTSGTSICFVEFWNLHSSRNIIKQLEQNGIENPSDYICFCGLRTFSDLGGAKVSEVVYVHSKLMIVDDSVVIMGSANVNDRSMLGTHDSETAVCVEDTEMVRFSILAFIFHL